MKYPILACYIIVLLLGLLLEDVFTGMTLPINVGGFAGDTEIH